MKRTGIFLIPTVYAAGGKLPMDYQFTVREIDRRTRFWKVNKKREVISFCAFDEAERLGLRIFRDETGAVCRILAPNGKAAQAFYAKIKSKGWED